MKFLSDRISISETAESSSIIISPDYDELKQKILLVWVVLWTLGGLLVVSQLFGDYGREEKMFLFVWSVFWLYFEYVGVYAWLWKKYGLEKFVVKKDTVYYYRSLNAGGKPQVMPKENISEIKRTKVSEKSILFNLSNSYWNMGSEGCEFRYKGRTFRFGLKLKPQESENLVNLLRKKIKN